jgi:hypothetical protein
MSDSYIQAVEKNIDAAGERTDEITRLREENARLRELLDDVFAQWDGDWPEELVARVKAAISGERAIGGPLATSIRRRS